MRIFSIATIVLANGISAATMAATPTISWEIENRFRYFTRASDFQNIADVYNSLKTAQNTKPSTLQLERAAGKPHPGGRMADKLILVGIRSGSGSRQARSSPFLYRHRRPPSRRSLLPLRDRQSSTGSPLSGWTCRSRKIRP
ncbi:hypothetical protein SAMN05444158_4080 [Bradyrhizobium canariense]|uniref:Uncharacterized protein n=1 Tax=Bradyrhizobium canariense TaxID=255045 RepID=A0A1H1WZQ2_9BRAD|nr:hypothetical protein SAMN05444158_4080 [Bradyrhizobium canariense]